MAIEQEGYTVQHIDEIQEGLDGSGNLLGYVFTVTTSEGYGGEMCIRDSLYSGRCLYSGLLDQYGEKSRGDGSKFHLYQRYGRAAVSYTHLCSL